MSSATYQQPSAPTQQPAGIATASLVLGIVGFFVGICSIVGLIVGLIARGKAKRGEIPTARIKAGITVSSISLALQVIGAVIVIGILAASGGSSTTTAPVAALPSPAAPAPTQAAPAPEESAQAPAPVESTPAPAATAPASAPPPAVSDGDWSLDKVQINDAAMGIVGATARITNHGAAVSSASFSVALEGSDGTIGTLTGFASDVAAGDTLTVDLVGTDKVTDPKVTDLKVSAF